MLDGKELLRGLREQLNESSTSTYIDTKTSYDYLYAGACEFIRRTACCTTTQTITSVATQSEYNLNSNYMGMYLQTDDGEHFIRYNDGTTTTFPRFKSYEQVVYENDTTSVVVPNRFTIFDDNTNYSRITGTATLAGALSGGQSVLTDGVGDFSNVNDGDVVHNTTDGSVGVVLSKTSSTALVTALFDGTNNYWSSSDAYVIQPQSRYILKMVPACSTAAHTITVYYIERPAPVYSDFGIYRIPQEYKMALIFYAAWLYKYRDSEPNFGDNFYQFFESEIQKAGYMINKITKRRRMEVSFKVV